VLAAAAALPRRLASIIGGPLDVEVTGNAEAVPVRSSIDVMAAMVASVCTRWYRCCCCG
jgi:hypothetical protein